MVNSTDTEISSLNRNFNGFGCVACLCMCLTMNWTNKPNQTKPMLHTMQCTHVCGDVWPFALEYLTESWDLTLDGGSDFLTINSNDFPMECDWSLYDLSCERCQQSTWTVVSHKQSSIKRIRMISIQAEIRNPIAFASISSTRSGGKDTFVFVVVFLHGFA